MKVWRSRWNDPKEGRRLAWGLTKIEADRKRLMWYHEIGYRRGYDWPEHLTTEVDFGETPDQFCLMLNVIFTHDNRWEGQCHYQHAKSLLPLPQR